MNTLDKIVGTHGTFLVDGATKTILPTGMAAFAIVVGTDLTTIDAVDEIINNAVVALDSATWEGVALAKGDYIAFANPINAITLTNAGDRVFLYLEPSDYVAPPTSLTATLDSGVAIDVAWTNNTNEDGVIIERSIDEVVWVVAATIAKESPAITTYKDEGLEEETKYYYRGKAFYLNNFSAVTATANATTGTIA
jgi:hypothetical protein